MKNGYSAVVIADVHIDKDGHDPVYDVVKRYIKRTKPDRVIIAGDYVECHPLSHWQVSKKCRIEVAGHRLELDAVEKELDFLQQYSGEVVWLEGNHENWVLQYLENHPEMEGLIEYDVTLELEERGIRWVPMNEIYWLGKLGVTHGMYLGNNHAKKHLDALGCNIMYGHTHRSDMHTMNMIHQPTMKAWGLACLCHKKPHFMKGKPAKWDNGFAQVYVADNGEFNVYPIDVINNRFYFNGKSYI